jgi:hypothetical protein
MNKKYYTFYKKTGCNRTTPAQKNRLTSIIPVHTLYLTFEN